MGGVSDAKQPSHEFKEFTRCGESSSRNVTGLNWILRIVTHETYLGKCGDAVNGYGEVVDVGNWVPYAKNVTTV